MKKPQVVVNELREGLKSWYSIATAIRSNHQIPVSLSKMDDLAELLEKYAAGKINYARTLSLDERTARELTHEARIVIASQDLPRLDRFIGSIEWLIDTYSIETGIVKAA